MKLIFCHILQFNFVFGKNWRGVPLTLGYIHPSWRLSLRILRRLSSIEPASRRNSAHAASYVLRGIPPLSLSLVLLLVMFYYGDGGLAVAVQPINEFFGVCPVEFQEASPKSRISRTCSRNKGLHYRRDENERFLRPSQLRKGKWNGVDFRKGKIEGSLFLGLTTPFQRAAAIPIFHYSRCKRRLERIASRNIRLRLI